VKLALSHRPPGGRFRLGPFDLDGPEDRPWLVLGATGSGKTTVLRLVSGVLGGGSPLSSPDRPAYLPQLPERALAGRNLAEDLCGEVRPALVRRLELRNVLEEAGLSGVPLSRRSRDLSQGERRRVALALLLLSGARAWALDEPEAGLDGTGRRHLADRLAVWWKTRNLSGLWIATHEFELYAPLKPWAVVLHDGDLLAQGPLPQVLARRDVFDALALGRRPLFQVWQALSKQHPGFPPANLTGGEIPGGRLGQLQVILTNRAGLR